jgi:hypothetical protein
MDDDLKADLAAELQGFDLAAAPEADPDDSLRSDLAAELNEAQVRALEQRIGDPAPDDLIATQHRASAAIAEFARGHPRFAELRTTMGELMHRALLEGRELDMDAAYHLAAKLNRR